MSYDVWGEMGGEMAEPLFADVHPAFSGDGMAGNVVVTERGYARCGNYTSNVRGIWRKCLSAVSGENLGLLDLAGRRMGDIAGVLHKAVGWGVEHIDELREDNPLNGWGNAEGAVTYLWDIARLCDANPDHDLRISA